jgi:hypothetical protein
MPKINIHIELDSNEKQTPELLAALSQAFGGAVAITHAAPKVEEPTKETEEPKEETEEPKEETPKTTGKKTKKTPKVEKEEAEDEGIGEETTVEELEEEANKKYNVDDVRTVMAEAKRSGKDSAKLRAILKANGAAVVSDLDPKNYAKVVKAVKAL